MIPKTATSIWQKIALVFLGLILSLVLLEAGLRLGGFVLLSIQEYGNLRSIKQKGTYRILCLGESTTQGQYPHLLEEDLNRRNIGMHFSVIDKGIPGANTLFISSRVESYLTEYHPDMVIAMMGVNDQGRHIPFEKATTSKWTLFIRSFRIYRLTRFLELHLLTKAREMGFLKPAGDKRSSVKVEIPLPATASKKTSAVPIRAEDSLEKANDYVGSGWFYRGQGDLSQSEASFKEAIKLNPENDDVYVALGRLYRERGELSQAEDFNRKAIEINPGNDNAYLELGRLYRERGELSQAEDFFKKAIALNPENDRAYVALGWLYRDRRKLSQAEDFFKKAIEFNPENERAYVALGWLYRNQGQLSQAEDSLKKAIETDPKNERILGAITSLYEEMGRPELAREYAEKVKTLRSECYDLVTVNNYRKLKGILDSRGIKLVCVQYPMRNVEPLKKIFENNTGVVFVDNEGVFKEALKKNGHKYQGYFSDMFAGDFGHCTPKGNELLAQNIADVILREVFEK